MSTTNLAHDYRGPPIPHPSNYSPRPQGYYNQPLPQQEYYSQHSGHSDAQHHNPTVEIYAPHSPQIPIGDSYSIKGATMPLVMAASIALFLIAATASTTKFFSSVENKLDSLGEKIDNVKKDVELKASEQWSKSAQNIWCAKTERVNANIGWKCAESIDPLRFGSIHSDQPSR